MGLSFFYSFTSTSSHRRGYSRKWRKIGVPTRRVFSFETTRNFSFKPTNDFSFKQTNDFSFETTRNFSFKPTNDLLFKPTREFSFKLKRNYSFIFNHFTVEKADCAKLFQGVYPKKRLKLRLYKKLPSSHNIRLTNLLLDSVTDPHFCDKFKADRRYVLEPLSDEEVNFSIAYSILLYTDVPMFERLLRAIYRPQNVYCVHVDKSSESEIHEGVRAIARCFENVFIPREIVDVVYAEFSSLYADLVCMRDLLKYARWKYLINLTGQEFPLRTNRELVRILTIFNGSNSVEGTLKYRYDHRYNAASKPIPDYLTVTKGAVHIAASRTFVDYAINNDTARRFLNWTVPTYSPDETFFTSLHYSPQLKVPGAYLGPPESYENNNNRFIARFKNWASGWEINGTMRLPCAGKYVRGICVFGVGDLKELGARPEMFANKFNSDFEPLAYDCLEERLHKRTTEELVRGDVELNESFYAELDFVKHHV